MQRTEVYEKVNLDSKRGKREMKKKDRRQGTVIQIQIQTEVRYTLQPGGAGRHVSVNGTRHMLVMHQYHTQCKTL